MLPFGLRSAPKIFNVIIDALEWILQHQGVEFCEHYLDDFIILGRPDSPECQQALPSLKCVRPAGSAASSPQERRSNHMPYISRNRDRYRSMRAAATTRQAGSTREPIKPVEQEEGMKACTTRDLQSLVGHLNHACKVVRPGRSFLRRIIDLLRVSLARRHRTSAVRLNLGFRSDMAW